MLIVHAVRSLRPAQIIRKQFLRAGGTALESHYEDCRIGRFDRHRLFDWQRRQIPFFLAVIVDY